MKRVECIARGRVQGVGYRLFVLGQANACKVKGWVRNESNESVRIVAEGEESELREFARRIKKSRFLQRIESLSVDWCEAQDEFDSFNVKY